MDNSMGVDIIIPVFNAYDDLVQCIDSIRKWTDMTKHRLIIVNDCSTDARILPYADSLRGEWCVVIHNKKNQGFSANVNIGMQQSVDRDVILLNSDTVVTKGWVEKLLHCAYRDTSIATVTPLSNNATICSIPYFFQENCLPDGFTVDTYAAFVEKVSLRKYPVIPVANGFCMLIKREVIDLIGNFDSDAFARGYGEENDFCYRAVQAGYRHVMCDDTFILHTGTSSFSDEEKKRNIQKHEKILNERYPDLVHQTQVFLQNCPVSCVSNNIRMWTEILECTKVRKTILYLLHADFREDAQDYLGGTQLHVKDLVDGLREQFNIVVAARNLNYLNVTFYTSDSEIHYRFYIGEKSRYEVLRSTKFSKLYGRILDAFHIGCVHVHHVAGVTLELYYEAVKRNIPVFTTLHDFYYICPNIKLLDERNHLCIDDKSSSCERCLKNRFGISETVDYISIWRKQHYEVLAMSEKIFVPSQSAVDIVRQFYPNLTDKTSVVGHGTKQMDLERNIRSKNMKKQKFRVAFLGAISVEKGQRIAIDLIQKGSQIQWYLFGYFGVTLPELERKRNYHNMGAYRREDLPKLLARHQIDLICIFSIWPETFCYTLSEAVAAGVPVLAFDIGALGERIIQMDIGWLISYQATMDEILQKITTLQEDSEEYQRKVQNVRRIQMKTDAQMCQEYACMYQDAFLDEGRYHWGQKDYQWLAAGATINDTQDNKEFDSAELQSRLAETERQLHEIANSFSYRIVLKAAKLRIPFRQQLKAILLKFYHESKK